MKLNCLWCGKQINLKDAALDYPENQFHDICFEYIERVVAIIEARIERKKHIYLSTDSLNKIAELKYNI